MHGAALGPEAQARLAQLHGRRVGIVGLAREGLDLARFLSHHGAAVVVSDRASPEALTEVLVRIADVSVELRLGHQEDGDLLDCDEIFVSPGVPREIPVVANAAAHGISLSSATRLYFELCPGPIAGITGSSGKTTTTSMVGAMLAEAGIPHVVGGNIGRPMLGRLHEITAETWSVLELSSFQLDDLEVSPRVGAVLNITPNHLDRHPDMADYIRAKGNLVRHQHPNDVAILNADEPNAAGLPHGSHTRWFSMEGTVDGAWFDGRRVWLGQGARPLLERSEIPLRGLHNVANTLAAAAVADAVGCSRPALVEAVRHFQAVPHRLEVVASVDGVTYINDSIATSPERSMAALRAIDEAVVLIAGGRDKHLPMEDWAQEIARHARGIVLVGEAAPLIEAALAATDVKVPRVRARHFAETVEMARGLAKPGDVVLLSPGCTSFDEFRDFEARGEAFRAMVKKLNQGPELG